MLMLHLRGAHCYHPSPNLGINQHLRMASTVAYTRKRRKGNAIAVAETPIVCVKHNFDEFRHVKKEPEQSALKKEEAKPLEIRKDPVLLSNTICSSSGAESKTAIRAPDQAGCEALLKVMDEMVEALAPLTFKPPVAFVYNPLEYARDPHEEYVRRYGGKKVEVLLVGMNPGPFGMAQTGVPFGDSVLVREFLHITSDAVPPKEMHAKRPIIGLKCPRREVSGQRLWGWALARFGTANTFLDRFWIHNYCPLMFMESSGKNRTPDKLTVTERASITSICNTALRAVIEVTQPRLIVGIGKYAGEKVKQCAPSGVEIGYIMHPSPANPKANKDWDKIIEAQLRGLGVEI